MKVVFLDMDGVMNGFLLWPETAGRLWIDPACVARLNAITDASGAVIVVTSTWRRYTRVPALLKRAGVTAPVIDMTPDLHEHSRGAEIQAWLDGAPDVERFVILDDDADMDHLLPSLVRTPFEHGLRDEHVTKALEVLGAR